MRQFVVLTLNGVSAGMVYSAIALALVLIWRATRIVNFAQGAMAMFTTYIALAVIQASDSYWLGFVAARWSPGWCWGRWSNGRWSGGWPRGRP